MAKGFGLDNFVSSFAPVISLLRISHNMFQGVWKTHWPGAGLGALGESQQSPKLAPTSMNGEPGIDHTHSAAHHFCNRFFRSLLKFISPLQRGLFLF